MSISDYTKEILDILDLNLTFEEDCLQKESVNGEICLVFYGQLSYHPEECFHCGEEETTRLMKWGFKEVTIQLNDVSEYQTLLKMKKQRFRCKTCGKTFVAETSVADRHCSIARRVKLAVTEKLTQPLSMSMVARMKHVSPTTVLRVLHSFEKKQVAPNASLPEVLCFDEFKSVKRVSGAMSFIMMNGQTRQLLDIVANRQLPHLQTYFARYSRQERAQVHYVVSDFYSPYASLVKALFPNAQFVIDRFHISQHIGRAFQQQRRQVMNSFHRRQKEYKHLKKYWKLLQKNEWALNDKNRHWRPSFRDHLTEQEIVDRLLNYHSALRQGYKIYQSFLSALHKQDVKRFDQLLKTDSSNFPEPFQPVMKTFRNYQQAIELALSVPYSNGPLEGLNNHIKVLKRVAYGFHSFENFRQRIFLYRGKYFQTVPSPTQTKAKKSS